ncbi:MAG: curli production assembly/transport component CsgF [bacterium]
MKKWRRYLLTSAITLGAWPSGPAHATELVYEFINPSFGGSYLNGTWLLADAQAQNKHHETRASITTDPIQEFADTVRRQVMYRLARDIVDKAFGEDTLTAGHYEVGDYIIDVSTDAAGITVIISDSLSDKSTKIEIPFY